MRLLSLDVEGRRVELHPYVSVVHGLDPGVRDALVRALAGLPAGQTGGWEGLIEAHGVMLDLSASSLRLLDLGLADGAEIQPVVRADDLPGAGAAPAVLARAELGRRRAELLDELTRAEIRAGRAARQLAACEEALAEHDGAPEPAGAGALGELRSLVEQRAMARAEAEAAAAAADAEVSRAAEQHASAIATVAAARQQRADVSRACAVAAGALEAARSARDPFAASALDVARQRLADLEAELEAGADAAGDAPPPVDVAALDAAIDDLERRRAPIEVALLALDSVDPFPVQVGLSQAEADPVGDLVPDEEAIALADEIEAADARVAEGGEAVDAAALVAARRRLEEARAALAEAERLVRVPEVDRDEIQRLEDAHGAVLDAHDKVQGRFSGARARQRLEEARQVEQEILDALGFLTYSDFIMGTSIMNIDPERERRLDAARGELAAAEDALAALTAGVDAEFAAVEQRARRRQLADRAEAILGERPDDVVWALRNRRVRRPAGGEHHERLRLALGAAGVAVDEAMPGHELVALARAWLAEQEHTAAERARLEGELAAIDTELAAARQARQDGEGAAASAAVLRARAESRVEEARTTLQAAEARVAQNADAEAEVARRKDELERLTEEEAQASAAVAEAEAAEADAAERAHRLTKARAGVAAELDAALDAELAAVDELHGLEEQQRAATGVDDRASREQAVTEARAEADEARAALHTVQSELVGIEDRLAGLPAADVADAAGDAADGAEEIEWYLLSRVAAQRAVSYAGSVPVVLDRALDGLPDGAAVRLVERLERMADAVQVVIVTEADELARWADAVGVDRAATLQAEPA